jgi:uncharacterized protein (DUF1800 family)
MIDQKLGQSLFDDPGQAWEPYRPTPAAPWDAARVAHLHRRTGFAATWGQLKRDLKDGYDESLHRVLEGNAHGPSGQPAADFAANVAAMEESARRRPSIERAQMLWLYRLIFTPFPLAEVMTLAWQGHYATSQAKVNVPELMLTQNNALRDLWRAPISKLHHRMLDDPAMRRWLDGLGSTKLQPNENLGREFLELFALGEGHYSERDVRDASRALTGWNEVDYQEHRDQLDPAAFDDRPKTILDETGPWGLDDLVRIVSRQPAAAMHIARRIYRTFIADTAQPPDSLLASLAGAMRVQDELEVARGTEMVLRSRLFHSAECRGKRVKSPVDYAIGIIRACELFAPPPDLVDLEIHLTRMGQRLFYPPSVAGWPAGLDWLGGQELVARANFAAWITGSSSPASAAHFDSLARRHGWNTPEILLDSLATLLVGATIAPATIPARSASEGPDRILTGAGPNPAQRSLEGIRSLISLPEAQLG